MLPVPAPPINTPKACVYTLCNTSNRVYPGPVKDYLALFSDCSSCVPRWRPVDVKPGHFHSRTSKGDADRLMDDLHLIDAIPYLVSSIEMVSMQDKRPHGVILPWSNARAFREAARIWPVPRWTRTLRHSLRRTTSAPAATPSGRRRRRTGRAPLGTRDTGICHQYSHQRRHRFAAGDRSAAGTRERGNPGGTRYLSRSGVAHRAPARHRPLHALSQDRPVRDQRSEIGDFCRCMYALCTGCVRIVCGNLRRPICVTRPRYQRTPESDRTRSAMRHAGWPCRNSPRHRTDARSAMCCRRGRAGGRTA